jgi:hypothetical protein
MKGCQSFSDPKDCFTKLKWHLVNSSNHYSDPAFVDDLFESMEAETDEVPKHWFDRANPVHVPEDDEAPDEAPDEAVEPHTPPLDAVGGPLAKRKRGQGGSASSSSRAEPVGINLQVDRTELSDHLTLRRSTLLTMLDTVERAAGAAQHAVAIAVTARDAFEKEERRLADCARQLARIVER